MKILLTGTHFTVAQAVIEEFRAYPKVELVYVGRATTLEGDPTPSQESLELPKLGVKFLPITAGRLQRSFTLYTIPSLLKIPIGFIQALWIVYKEKPDVVLSFGGYVSLPVVLSAWLFSIPIIIHVQTLVTPLASKLSSPMTDKIAVSFDTDYDFDQVKIVLTGNPLRKHVTKISFPHSMWESKPKVPTILITGGNQGSHVINLAVEEILEEFKKVAHVIHQTGDSKFKDYERLENLQDDNYQVFKFIPNMGDVMKKTDLVIGRAGINTLAELAYLGIPTLVIPIPYLFADEQNKNARYFEKLGLVKILPQSRLSGKSLLENIEEMLKNLENLKIEAKNAKSVIIPNAAKKLALETVVLASR